MTTVLLTGGTGSFGRAFLQEVLPLGWTVRVFSRDEWKQSILKDEVQGDVRWLIGDVRDKARVLRAAEGCDLVVHAAALKQVPSCEYNPWEAIHTNVIGSHNVAEAALDLNIPRSILLSSDKAVHPVNIYGASKLCAEKLWLGANAYAGTRDVRFSVVRYGNVLGSRGSVHEKWAGASTVTLTDRRATRFWLELQDAVQLVLTCHQGMRGREVYVPKIGSSRVSDHLPRGANVVETGLLPGEKLHETLISEEELGRTWDCGTHYRVCDYEPQGALRVPEEFRYTSEAAA